MIKSLKTKPIYFPIERNLLEIKNDIVHGIIQIELMTNILYFDIDMIQQIHFKTYELKFSLNLRPPLDYSDNIEKHQIRKFKATKFSKPDVFLNSESYQLSGQST